MWGGGWGHMHGHSGSGAEEWRRNRYARYGRTGLSTRGLLNILDDEELGRVYDHKVVMRFLPYLRPYLAIALVSLVFMLVYTATLVSIPWLIGYAIDSYIIPGDKRGIDLILGIFIAVGIMNYAGNYIYLRTISWVSQRVLYDLRTQMYDHIQQLSVPFFDQNEVGRVMSRVQNDVNQLQEFLPMVVLAVGDILSLGGIIVVMLLMNFELALATFVVIPILVVVMIFWQRYASTAFVRVRQAISIVNGRLQQNISGVRVVQSFNREDTNRREFDEVNYAHLDANLRAIRFAATLMPTVEILTAVALSMVLLVGGRMVLNNPTELGDLVAFVLFVQRFFDPIRNLTMQYTQFQRAMTAGIRIFELLDIEPEVVDRSDAVALPSPIKGDVRYKSVGFHYIESVPVLQEVDLHIRAGQTVALVGPTGAGKTTMVSLLARFYDVVDGHITVDGHDLREITRSSLTHQMSMVQQEPFLFSATVADNIKYRHQEATQEQVERAASAVGAHEFITRLEHGYDTMLQERGGNLSIGQRQLISFARAILAEPRIIILDEATANIDTYTEMLIQRGLAEMLRGRTALVIAHRLSTVQNADMIVVMDHGRIVDTGTHQELLERGGIYARLYALNFHDPEDGTTAPSSVDGDSHREVPGRRKRPAPASGEAP